ncbi:hypothetical protein CK203_032279 [Vitis vinifera]|uniref:Uncharacterized protein n=1 Tax=Vitis vinifera TaxID=29760 RepID=A0A438IJT4_VITVI|nr:hypothetical protein CK203_032279 [Vitis vinifera]
MAFSIMGATLFGDAFLAWSKASVYEELLMMIAKDACFWASYGVTPFWKQGFWRYQRLCMKLKSLTQDGIEQCRQNYKLFSHMDKNSNSEISNPETKNAPKAPFSSGILMPDNLSSQECNGHVNAREEPCGNIMRVMFHGCLTTAGLIGNILARLATHPEIQDKLLGFLSPELGVVLNVVLTRIAGKENGNRLGSSGKGLGMVCGGFWAQVPVGTSGIYSEIIMSRKGAQKQKQQNVDKMLVLLATVYESARLMPAGPLLQRCSLKHDLNLKTGLTIPAGAILVVPVQLVQMDDSCWGMTLGSLIHIDFCLKLHGDIEIEGGGGGGVGGQRALAPPLGTVEDLVDPDQDSCILDDPNHNAAFLPFGSGTRACVGQKFCNSWSCRLIWHLCSNTTRFVAFPLTISIRLQPGSEDDPKPMLNDSVLQLLPSPKIVFMKRNSRE